MPKKLQDSELEEIIKPLPPKERMALREQSLSPQWLEENIARSKSLMKRDLWVGLPWFLVYSAALFSNGIGKLSIGIFVLGMFYFTYTIFTTGSYGLNKKRVKVYSQLLNRIK